MVRLYTWFTGLILLFAAVLSSCQKDENVSASKTVTQAQVDSAQKANAAPVPGNYLASKGTLKIKLQDSTYTFDASTDSIVFVNISLDGKEYYGVTAINKAHTLSFGISSMGAPIAEMPGSVAGCQLLFNAPQKSNLAYTLSRSATPQDYGSLSLEKYNQDTILAKGTFHTYLARDTKKDSPFYVADGTFELKVK